MTEPVQIVRYAELVPCRTAFIDAHTPGSVSYTHLRAHETGA